MVVRTVPQSGDLAVDPTLKEISVTFSKDMTTVEMWSWAEITPDSFPKLAGKPHYLGDRRTCVLPVKLEPGRTYAIWVNSARHDNFRDQGNRPAVPYLLQGVRRCLLVHSRPSLGHQSAAVAGKRKSSCHSPPALFDSPPATLEAAQAAMRPALPPAADRGPWPLLPSPTSSGLPNDPEPLTEESR